MVSSPFLLRILNIDFFFYYVLLPVLSLYSLSSYCFLFCSCQPITIVTCLSYLMPFVFFFFFFRVRWEAGRLGCWDELPSPPPPNSSLVPQSHPEPGPDSSALAERPPSARAYPARGEGLRATVLGPHLGSPQIGRPRSGSRLKRASSLRSRGL